MAERFPPAEEGVLETTELTMVLPRARERPGQTEEDGAAPPRRLGTSWGAVWGESDLSSAPPRRAALEPAVWLPGALELTLTLHSVRHPDLGFGNWGLFLGTRLGSVNSCLEEGSVCHSLRPIID